MERYLNSIQIYFLKVIKPSFSLFSIENFFELGKCLAMIPEIPFCILSPYLWYSKSIQVDNTSVYFLKFSDENINYVSQLFSENGSIKQWHKFKREHNLHESFYFHWLQLIDAISQRWEIIIKENYENAVNLIIHDHNLVKCSKVITLDKLTSTEICSILISRVQTKPSSKIYFKICIICMLPRLITYNTYMRSFQYKILNNVSFLNKKLHTFTHTSYFMQNFILHTYFMKHLIIYLMNVIVLNVYGLI